MPRHLPLAALLMAGAGGTHLAAAVPHFSDNALYGLLFVGAGWLQVLLAAALLVSGRAGVARTAMVVNVLAVAAWGVSRTVGLPLVPPEPVGVADAVMVMLELGAIGVLASRAWGASFGLRGAQISAVSLAAVLALTVGGSTVAIAGLASEGHHAEASQPSGSHGETEQPRTDETSHGGGLQSDNAGTATDAVHVHPDGSVHVHEAGTAHGHPDGTVHILQDGQPRAQVGAGGHGDKQPHPHEEGESH